MNRPALFLDRDGVINVDHGYVHRPEGFEFVEGIFDVVVAAKRAGYIVIVVTNQAGIGRGYYSEAQFCALTDWMKAKFAEHGAQIDAVYFCPYHPEHGIGKYRRESEFRKPAPGMLLQAQRELNIDLSSSIFIGDKVSDMQAGRAAGVGRLLLLGGSDLSPDSVPVQQLSDVLPYLTTRGFYRAKGDACVSVSIVSHGHGEMVGHLVAKLQSFPEVGQVILTRNIPDIDGVAEAQKTLIIQNTNSKGFGANHNAAFAHAKAPFFCVLNPDIELLANPFPTLLAALNGSSAAVLAPGVVNSAGSPEDSARRFPTLRQLATKLLGGHDGRYALQPTQGPMPADWVAGMFMLFRAQDFKAIGGFDEKFFLYYEDVDICTRLWKAGRPVMACPQVQVVHDAQRASRKNLQFMKWHAASMARYFWKHWGRLPRKSVS